MKLFKAASLVLLPGLAAAQVIGGGDCDNFELLVNDITFTWKNYKPYETKRQVNIDPNYDDHTSSISWGGPATANGQSGLQASEHGSEIPIDGEINVSPNTQFQLGQMKHINYPIWGGTQINYVELCIVLHTSEGDYPFNYDLQIHETWNQGLAKNCPYPSEIPCADRVLILNDPSPHEILTVNKMRFELDLVGFRDTPTSAAKTNFTSEENGETVAGLWGTLFLTDCPGGGGSMGDPHFQTWTGHWYDFQGACDLHLVTAPEFAPNTPLSIDVRTQTRDWYSFIETAAIRIGDDVLEVSGFGVYFLNGVEGTRLPKMMAGKYAVSHKEISKKSHEFDVKLGGGEHIIVHTFKDLVSVKIQNAHQDRFVGSGGMMGNFRTGEVYTRDGKNIVVDPEEIAREWQVRDNEPMLFQAANGPQFPQQCTMPKKQQVGGRLGKTIALMAAEEACAHWDPDTKDLCVQDVMKTGDIEIAEAGTF